MLWCCVCEACEVVLLCCACEVVPSLLWCRSNAMGELCVLILWCYGAMVCAMLVKYSVHVVLMC